MNKLLSFELIGTAIISLTLGLIFFNDNLDKDIRYGIGFLIVGITYLLMFKKGYGLATMKDRIKAEGFLSWFFNYLILNKKIVSSRNSIKGEKSDLGWAAVLYLSLPLAVLLGLMAKRLIYN